MESSSGDSTATESFGAYAKWPLYSVLPAASAAFWLGYLFLWPVFASSCGSVRHEYSRLDRIGRACFVANLGSAVHSYTVTIALLIVLATDMELRSNRLHRHFNPLGYSAMCVTLGYFSLSIPWSLRMLFKEKRKDVVPPAMLLHHVLVVAGALIYVLGGVCAFYGALAFACMELSNLFFIPRVLYEVLGWRVDGGLCTLNGLCLVLTFTLCRVGVCTGFLVVFTRDLAEFESAYPAEWALVILAYAIYVSVLILSWVWLRKVLGELRDGVRALLRQRRAMRAQQAKLAALAAGKSPERLAPTPPGKHAANGGGACGGGACGDGDYIASRGDDQPSPRLPPSLAPTPEPLFTVEAPAPHRKHGLRLPFGGPPKVHPASSA